MDVPTTFNLSPMFPRNKRIRCDEHILCGEEGPVKIIGASRRVDRLKTLIVSSPLEMIVSGQGESPQRLTLAVLLCACGYAIVIAIGGVPDVGSVMNYMVTATR